MAASKSLQELIEELPPELEQQVTDFVLFVLQRHTQAAPDTGNALLEIAELADTNDWRSGREDVSSRAGELTQQILAEEFARRRGEQDASE